MMTTNLLLALPNLPPDFIDCSVGEPHLVRDNLIKIFHLEEELKIGHFKVKDLTYPTPTGYQPLVKLLEDKHGAPVIITNGAKQALGACFYALKKLGRDVVSMRVPYWALLPPLMEMHGVTCASIMKWPPHYSDSEFWKRESFLYVGPNNPDGFIHNDHELIKNFDSCKENGMPFIHDAAYYTHIYLPKTHSLPDIGDVQVYSISKMLGLSGLRLGYVVCHNQEYYKLIQEYMEAMTVGVSIASQTFLFDLLSNMQSSPDLVAKFEAISAFELARNKKLCLQINPEVLEVPQDYHNTPGMFGFFKVGPKANFVKSKVNLIDGSLFGKPGYVRINLALQEDTMKEVIKRLNY